ncbi:glucokinase [Cyanobium sp. CH-040]|uniref:glucokinase n=1 Tax=Cyanobium sp. CH-040 TaxID=2823708 RepID=UPI0020CEED12|nr:glucokinase [Cyanobium sp. CH-040]MCP9926811.1 glucokinase [Cyanobium sp. CH-040]
MTIVLAGDIGGTKTLLALYRTREEQLEPLCSRRYGSEEWPDLAPMVLAFLAEARETGAAQEAPAAACFAVAGPVQQGTARLTNLPWQLEERELSAATGIPVVDLVNDFAVLIYGLLHLGPAQQASIRQGSACGDEPVLVLGAGTGLGVAYGVPGADGLVAVASEAAHAEFAPRHEAEWDLKQWLGADLGISRVSIERVVSGTGLGHVARWLLSRRHPDGDHPLQRVTGDLPAAVASAAAQADPLAREALDLWLDAYGSVAGDLALTGLCRGGIWLAGGTAGKLLMELRGPLFRRAFLNKGRLASVLEPIPITAVTDPAIGEFSAACRARMLLGAAG